MENTSTRNLNENTGDRLRRARQSLDELRAESQARARRAFRDTNNYAHDHPWNVVGGAAALAFIAGMLMRGRSRKIIVRKPKDAPVLKVKKVKSHSPWETLSALMPIALVAFKAYQAKHKPAQPKVDTSTPVM